MAVQALFHTTDIATMTRGAFDSPTTLESWSRYETNQVFTSTVCVLQATKICVLQRRELIPRAAMWLTKHGASRSRRKGMTEKEKKTSLG